MITSLTNSILKDGILYYVDYECNAYMEEWNFENWGIKYWSKTQDFMKYVDRIIINVVLCGWRKKMTA